MWTAVTVGDVEFYSLTFIQRFETVALDSGEVYEYVFTVLNLDKAIAFFCVEPLNCSFQMNNLLNLSPYTTNILIIHMPRIKSNHTSITSNSDVPGMNGRSDCSSRGAAPAFRIAANSASICGYGSQRSDLSG